MNSKLKARIVEKGLTQTQLAKELGMNTRTFYLKINHRKLPSGNTARFKESEKVWLSQRLNMDVRAIE